MTDVETDILWLVDTLQWEAVMPILSTWPVLHFVYENIAKKTNRENFIADAFNDCEVLDTTWDKCYESEKRKYIFADYTLNFPIEEWLSYYEWNLEDYGLKGENSSLKVSVKNLAGLDPTLLSQINNDFENIGKIPWYINNYILSDYWPLRIGGGIESKLTYELTWISFPKADFSRIFVFWGGQGYPLEPYITILFKKYNYLVKVFFTDNSFLPKDWRDTYYNYFQWHQVSDASTNEKAFVDYIAKDTEFMIYVDSYLKKVFKVLEIAE